MHLFLYDQFFDKTINLLIIGTCECRLHGFSIIYRYETVIIRSFFIKSKPILKSSRAPHLPRGLLYQLYIFYLCDGDALAGTEWKIICFYCDASFAHLHILIIIEDLRLQHYFITLLQIIQNTHFLASSTQSLKYRFEHIHILHYFIPKDNMKMVKIALNLMLFACCIANHIAEEPNEQCSWRGFKECPIESSGSNPVCDNTVPF